MDVVKVKVLTELKVKGKIYRKNKILEYPFHPAILDEIRAIQSGKVIPPTLEILERGAVTKDAPKMEEVIEGSEEPKPALEIKNEKQKPVLRKPTLRK